MSRRGLLLCFAVAFVAAMPLLLPLRLVSGRLGVAGGSLAADEIAGSVWSGRLRGLRWHQRPLGDVSLRLQPLPLLAGVRRLRVESDATSSGARSLAILQGRVRGVEDGNGEFVLAGFPGLPDATARISLRGAALTFSDDRCRGAEGEVRVELQLPAAASAQPVALAGRLACAGQLGRLVLAPEASAAQPLALEATLEIEADGRYRLQSLARSDDPGTRLALQLAGFQDSPAGMSRVDAGSLAE